MEQRAVNKIFKFNQMWIPLAPTDHLMLDLIYDAFKPFAIELEKEILSISGGSVINPLAITHKASGHDDTKFHEYLYRAIQSLYNKNSDFQSAFDELVA